MHFPTVFAPLVTLACVLVAPFLDADAAFAQSPIARYAAAARSERPDGPLVAVAATAEAQAVSGAAASLPWLQAAPAGPVRSFTGPGRSFTEGYRSSDTITSTARGAQAALLPSQVALGDPTPSPATLGQSVTLTATVAAGATGLVTFFDDATLLGVAPVVAGRATLSVSGLGVGGHSLRARYGGDASYAKGDSAARRLNVANQPSLSFKTFSSYDVAAPADFFVGDLNSDGKPDLAVVYGTGDLARLRILAGNGDGTFRDTATYSLGTNPVRVVAADFDGDGKTDLAVSDRVEKAIRLFRGRGDATFQAGAVIALGADAPDFIVAGDFDRDGRADLVAATLASGVVVLLGGNGDGTFQAPVGGSLGCAILRLASGDFNADGVPDLAVVFDDGFYTLSVWLGQSDGGFPFANRWSTRLGLPGWFDINSADLDGDSVNDLLVSNSAYPRVCVYSGRGDGSFVAGACAGLQESPLMLAITDLNANGVLDLVVANKDPSGGQTLLQMRGGDGGGTFWLNGDLLPTGIRAGMPMRTADLNGDGRPDLVMSFSSIFGATGGISILLGDGWPAPSLRLALSASTLAAGQSGTLQMLVRNASATVATTAGVSVELKLRGDLTLLSMAGAGWSCAGAICTRPDTLAPGGQYPSIVATVAVSAAPGILQIVTAQASGGGSNPAAAELMASATFAMVPSPLHFGSVQPSGAVTPPQAVRLTFPTIPPYYWTARSFDSWIRVAPGFGSGNGTITVSVDASSLAPGTYHGTVWVDSEYHYGARHVPVDLTVMSGQTATAPYGSFDTPTGSATLSSNVAVSGWALDDVGVARVSLWRDPVVGETAGMLVYVGDATFVAGARPDVEAAMPNAPQARRAGWGYALLTNALPGQGNGTYKLHAFATDLEGHQTLLGSKTVTVDNAHAVKPFGAIDTPAPGAVVSGAAFVNFGWALTPQPGRIPSDGSTIGVFVDGMKLGTVNYNHARSDVDTLFPGYLNTGGAVGYRYLDTTGLANGTHTLAWSVTDNLGRTDGVGSRYFDVMNGASAARPPALAPAGAASQTSAAWRKGYAEDAQLVPLPQVDAAAGAVVEIGELERLEFHLPALADPQARWSGGVAVGGERRALPVGSSLDAVSGVFCWQLGPGFLGEFPLEFSSDDGQRVRIVVRVSAGDTPHGSE